MSKDKPLVSAVVLTHNRLSLLKRAIRSVREQTYSNIELIIVDDASTDGTKDYFQNDNSLKYIYIPPDESLGGNYARNKGIENAKGEYIAFLDDDDYWLPKKIEKQIELSLQTGLKVIHGPKINEVVDKFGRLTLKEDNYTIWQGDLSKFILYNICIITSGFLVERDLIMKIGNFDENLKFWQEYELSIRLAQETRFGCVQEPLYVYRINLKDPHRLTNKYWEWKKAVKYIRSKHKNLFHSLSFQDRLRMLKLEYSDGITRSYASGLKFEWYKNRIILKTLKIIGL